MEGNRKTQTGIAEKAMDRLLAQIRQCIICEAHLPLCPRPVLSASPESRICIIGQAPGMKVHESGIPWNDRSGINLRSWLGVTEDEFYDTHRFAIIPMGFCYPGRGASGDLPPRPECAPAWHQLLLENMPRVKLTLLVGRYAHKYYLNESAAVSVTKTVSKYEDYLPGFVPLPHPSPRNRFWLKKNPWFETELLPKLRSIIRTIS